MILIDVVQGSDAWHAIRARHFTASEAPVMMNASSKMRRNELLHMKATGSEKEVCAWVQKNLFDKGHVQEASSRIVVEKMIDQELYPTTATDDAGRLLASFDGMTMMQDVLYEHKMWNAKLAEAVRNEDLDPEYYWQLEQQLLVSGAEYVCFVCSDGTRENFVSMDYYPVEGRAKALQAGWDQFEKDLATYVPTEAKEVAVAKAIKGLPALNVQLTGKVTDSNLIVYKETALDFIKNINTNLKTDQDFADAEATVKFCDKAEKELELVKSQALSQTATIDELFRTIDQLKDELRNKRLLLEKSVKNRKEAIRVEIKDKADKALYDHIATINARIGPRIQLPAMTADFVGVMKGKRTIATLQDAVDSELARVKIESNAIAELIEINLVALRALDAKYRQLFPDAQALVQKPADDFLAVLKMRTSEFDTAEAERLENERIANEAETARLKKIEDDRAEAERLAREQAEAPRVELSLPSDDEEPEGQLTLVAEEPTVGDQPEPVAVEATKPSSSSAYKPEKFTAELVDIKLLAAAVGSGSAPASLLQVNIQALEAFVGINGRKFALPGISIKAVQ